MNQTKLKPPFPLEISNRIINMYFVELKSLKIISTELNVSKIGIKTVIKDLITDDVIAKRKENTKLLMKSNNKKHFLGMRHSPESIEKIKNARRKYLSENKISSWNNKSKYHTSWFCEEVKTKLKEKEISFIEEHQPLRHINRFFSVDIVLPNKKVGFELNGNQHYNVDGSLKEYYQKRHNLIENDGWKLFEIKYTKDINGVVEFIESTVNCKDIMNLSECNFIKYKNTKTAESESDKISRLKKVREDSAFSNRKVKNRPSKEELFNMINSIPTTKIASQYGVTSNAIKRWCNSYSIQTKPRGYWTKFKSK